MELYRKNNIIVNAVKHKGTIEEKHPHIETQGLVRDKGKPTTRKSFSNYSSY